jgi:hypothetical protein
MIKLTVTIQERTREYTNPGASSDYIIMNGHSFKLICGYEYSNYMYRVRH